MQFKEEEIKLLKELINDYKRFRYLVELSEGIGDREVFIPTLRENRLAFDHLAKALDRHMVIEKDTRADNDLERNINDLNESIEHLIEGTIETIDFISVILAEEYYKLSDGVTSEYLNTHMPEFTSKFYPMIFDLEKKIAAIRRNEDIFERNIIIDDCISLIENLIKARNDILPILSVHREEKRRKTQIVDLMHFFMLVISAIMGAVITLIYMKFVI